MATTTTHSAIGARLAGQLGQRLENDSRFEQLFEQARWELGQGQLKLQVGNRFTCDLMRRNYQAYLDAAVAAEFGESVQLQICVGDFAAAETQQHSGQAIDQTKQPSARSDSASAASASPPTATRPSQGRGKKFQHRLDDFVVGASNELAYATACRLVDQATPGGMQMVFVHGGCGLGKTHLLQGVCGRYAKANRQRRWRYVTAEQFTNEYISAVRSNDVGRFRRRMRKLDLLAIDDVHFLSSKNATQQEFLHTLDAIGLHGARVIFASDNHPKAIKAFSEALVSRFLSGMVVKIDEPDPGMRTRLVESLAARRQLMLETSVVERLASCPAGSVREVEGMLTRLAAVASLDGGRDSADRIGHAVVDRMLGETVTYTGRPIRFEQILDTVCELMQVDRSQAMSKSRHRRVVLARSLAVFLARELTTMSFPELAAALQRSNHSTIVTAAQRMQRQIDEDVAVRLIGESEPVTLGRLAERARRRVQESAYRGPR